MTDQMSGPPVQTRDTAVGLLRLLSGGIGVLGKKAVPILAGLLGDDVRAIRQALRRFQEQGIITRKRHGRYVQFLPSEKGRTRLEQYLVADLTLHDSPAPWDGRWRIVLLDITEERRHLRAAFRRAFVRLGFAPLQRSAWISPLPCQEPIEQLARKLNLASGIVIVTAESITGEEQYVKRFGLQRGAVERTDDDYEFVTLAEF